MQCTSVTRMPCKCAKCHHQFLNFCFCHWASRQRNIYKWRDMVLASVSKLTAFNFIIILRIIGQSSQSLSSGREQTCLHSNGKWMWTLQSNRLLAQQMATEVYIKEWWSGKCQLVFGNSVDDIAGSGRCREEMFFIESGNRYPSLSRLSII